MKKMVDVAVNVYGKPYQTLAILNTLRLHGGKQGGFFNNDALFMHSLVI
jgi:hypothetical protein